jgi:hypothetical protein
VLALAASCSREALQPDAGGSGTISLDGGRATDAALAADAAWDAPFVGRASFIISASVILEGGTTSHSFTMALDGDRQLAIAGAFGAGAAVPVQQISSGRFRIASALSVLSPSHTLEGGCYDTFVYEDITFSFDGMGRLVGTGTGRVALLGSDGGNAHPATMSLIGYADMNAPGLGFSVADTQIDSFTPFSVISEEPLPRDVRPALRGGGDAVVLVPTAREGDFVIAFDKPPVLLRYAQQYSLDVGGVVDFAGNVVAGSGPSFSTGPLPPLVAADGFESLSGPSLGGADVLSGTNAPTISGAHSLWVPPQAHSLEATTLSPATQFALRLAIRAGDTVVRFAYRTVNPGSGPAATFAVASVGGTIATMLVPADDAVTTTAVIGTSQVTLGPITTATIGLPADAASEIVLARIAPPLETCGGPRPPAVPGVIIDDLRTE